jgi:hypothetical protein
LIELLVSITIMAVVAAVVVSATRSGLAMWDKGSDHLQTLRRSRVILDVLNDQIRGALPMTYVVRTTERATELPAFDGRRTGLLFVSRSSFKDGPDGIARWIDVEWVHDPQKPTGELTVEERRILPPDNTADAAVEWRGVILQGQSCTFDFLQDAQASTPATWFQEWRYPIRVTLPKAIRLNCVSASKQPMQWLSALDYYESSVGGLKLR